MALSQRVEALGKRFETLFAQADDLTKKQLLARRAARAVPQVDDLAKKASWQMDTLRQSRQDLEVAAEGNAGLLQVARRER